MFAGKLTRDLLKPTVAHESHAIAHAYDYAMPCSLSLAKNHCRRRPTMPRTSLPVQAPERGAIPVWARLSVECWQIQRLRSHWQQHERSRKVQETKTSAHLKSSKHRDPSEIFINILEFARIRRPGASETVAANQGPTKFLNSFCNVWK